MTELTHLMHQRLLEGGVLLAEQKPHMEVLDETNGYVWMSVGGVTQQQFDDFELESNWRKIGRACGVMDQALFCHSPNASNQPVRERLINELTFINVAQVISQRKAAGGLTEIMVNKNHVLGFDTNRQLSILQLNGRHYVEVVAEAKGDTDVPLIDGATIQKITLDKPWLVDLPAPTQTFWIFQPSLRSFQGPVKLPR